MSERHITALEELRAMIEEHWPHDNPYWREGEMQFAPTIDAIADRIEAEYTLNSEIEAKYMPYPLDADGVPCRLGDYVRSCETYGNIKEMLLFGRGGKRWEIYLTTLDDSVPADGLHHVEQPKLTKEDIDALAKTSFQKYWNCEWDWCDECPAKIQGKNPNVYYEVPYCSQAQILDILRLERERVAGEL